MVFFCSLILSSFLVFIEAVKYAMQYKVMTDLKDKRLYLVDGSGFIFRAFHALPPLNRSDGVPINAVLGFTNMLMKLLVEIHAHYLAVVFDAARENFRNEIYPDYKAHRPLPPEELVPQFSLIREACTAFNVPVIQMEGFEADDLIATLAKQATARGMQTIIVSSDKDLMQLINGSVTMFDAMKNKTIGVEQVYEKFGVGPEHVVDVQALTGDSVDNIPGVPGIGLKTAAELINEFGDLENLLAHAHTIKQQKRRERLIQYADSARISYRLVKLRDDVPLQVDILSLEVQPPHPEKLLQFLKNQEFYSIINRLERLGEVSTPEEPDLHLNCIQKNYTLVQDKSTLQHWIDKIWDCGVVAFDTETTSLNAHIAKLVGVSLCCEPGQACYIPLKHRSEEADLLSPKKVIRQMDFDEALQALKPVLEHPGVLKIGQNIKYDALVMARYGIFIAPYDDTMVLSYVLDGAKLRHNLNELARHHLDIQTITFPDIIGSSHKTKTFDQVDLEKAKEYSAEDADMTMRLHHVLQPRLTQEHQNTVYYTIDRPLIPVLTKMEAHGVKLDVAYLKQLSQEFAQRLSQLEEEIFLMAGTSFNIASPKQLGEILFDRLGIPGGKKGKNDAYVTGADVLEKLAMDGFEIAEKVIMWRQLAKLKGTYTDALPEQINPLTGRVHTSYHMASTSTGRLSSSDPNLQNIPVRTEEGRKIRQAFIPEAGSKIVSFDYSQIELRLLAHVADIATLKQAFQEGQDIHALTASHVFHIPLDQVTPEIRSRAKAINFGIIYGISPFGLARQLGISRTEAGNYITSYLHHYPGIHDFMENMKIDAANHGYVLTILGRKCFIIDIHSKNPARRSFAERQAINAPLQGSNADIIKKAMCRIDKALEKSGLRAKMLLQVHDELIFEVPTEELEATKALVKPIMENVVHLSVPLIVDVHVGDNWAQAK